MDTLKDRGLRLIHAKLDLAERLGDQLTVTLQASLINDPRCRNLDELRKSYRTKAEGMAEVLQKLEIISADDLYRVIDRCAHLEGREQLQIRRGG